MVDLVTVANVAQIVEAVTLVGAAVFAVIQIREHRHQRRQEASISLMQSMLTGDVQRAIMSTWSLPEGSSAQDVRNRGPGAEEAAFTILWSCENMGVLVQEGVLDLDTVEKLLGGTIRDCYRRLVPWLEDERKRVGSDTLGEWFQWLAMQLERHGDPRKREGAFIQYAAWRPR